MFRVENKVLYLGVSPEKRILVGGLGHLNEADTQSVHGALLLASLAHAQHSQINVMTHTDPKYLHLNHHAFNSYLDLREDLGLDTVE